MKKVLLFPGLGDVHWCLIKLQAFLERRGVTDPVEVSIWDIDDRPRVLEYLDLVPWLKKGNYWKMPLKASIVLRRQFDTLYMTAGTQDYIHNFRGQWDYLVGTNGNMRNGAPWGGVLAGARSNYAYGPILPDDSYGQAHLARGPYFVLGFSGHGMFSNDWVNNMPARKIRPLVEKLRRAYPGHRFVFTGLGWDREFAATLITPEDEMLVGQTTLVQFLSLIKNAYGYLGWCGGNAILAQHLGTPTVVWWSRKYFPLHDRSGWETPHPTPRHLVLEVEDYRNEETPQHILNFLEVAHARDC